MSTAGLDTCWGDAVRTETGWVCTRHGSRYSPTSSACLTTQVLEEVSLERARQFAEYGTNDDLEDGTGPMVQWLAPVWEGRAISADAMFRADYIGYESAHGKPTWMHLVREEVAEAFRESDLARLRAELIQVAALCVSWVEKLDTRAEAAPSTTPADELESWADDIENADVPELPDPEEVDCSECEGYGTRDEVARWLSGNSRVRGTLSPTAERRENQGGEDCGPQEIPG